MRNTKERYAIIEFFRFVFALWIVYYHKYFPVCTEQFSEGYLAVEFFFVVSGFFMLKTFEKHKNDSILKGGLQIIYKTLKSLSWTLLISTVFMIWFAIANYHGYVDYLDFPGYLWYVLCLTLVQFLYFALYKLTNSKKVFAILMLLIFAICAHFFHLNLGILRAFGTISLGILISFVPKINIKNSTMDTCVKITGLVLCVIACFALAKNPNKNVLLNSLLYIVCYPLLVYFAQLLPTPPHSRFHKTLCFLGSLSFGIYAYQCVLRVLRFYGMTDAMMLFCLLMLFVFATNFQKLQQLLKNTAQLKLAV